jgi:hypothetical protein
LVPVALLATATSITIAAQTSAQTARLSASQRTVPFGERFALAGSVPGIGGTKVRIKFRPSGARRWKLLDTVHTDPRGTYRDRARAHRSGFYRAVPGRGHASLPEAVRVRSAAALHVAKHSVVLGNGVRLEGLVRPGGHRPVKVVVRGPGGGVVRDASSRRGRYALRGRPRGTGSYKLRAYAGANKRALGSSSVARRVTVYRYAAASWYGPGLYGNKLGCGGTLTAGTLGVAHKSLPCGTKVTFRRNGRTVRVPVVDRGPYVGGREYDLTAATAQKLGFQGHGPIQATR